MAHITKSKGEDYEEYLAARLAQVQSYLASHQSLKTLSDNFESYRRIETVRNVLFNLCLNRSSEIDEFERFLSAYDVLNWKPGRLREIKGRIIQNSLEESMSILMEGLVTNHYSSRIEPSKVEPSPSVSRGGRCDIKVTPDKTSIFFELTALGIGKFELNLESVLSRFADFVLDQLNAKRIVKMEVDVSKLPNDLDGHLDPTASAEMLMFYSKRLHLAELFNSNISPLSLSTDEIELLPDKKKTIYDHELWELWPGMSMLQASDGYYLPGLMSKPAFREWSQKITPEMVLGCPIVYILTGGGKWPLVEISDKLSFPSASATREGPAFLDRVKKRLQEKMRGGQLEENAPNIIVIRAADWLSYGFEGDRDMMPLGFPDIEKAILSTLAQEKNPNVSEVRIYESEYPRARVVSNPYVGPKSQITPQERERLDPASQTTQAIN